MICEMTNWDWYLAGFSAFAGVATWGIAAGAVFMIGSLLALIFKLGKRN